MKDRERGYCTLMHCFFQTSQIISGNWDKSGQALYSSELYHILMELLDLLLSSCKGSQIKGKEHLCAASRMGSHAPLRHSCP